MQFIFGHLGKSRTQLGFGTWVFGGFEKARDLHIPLQSRVLFFILDLPTVVSRVSGWTA